MSKPANVEPALVMGLDCGMPWPVEQIFAHHPEAAGADVIFCGKPFLEKLRGHFAGQLRPIGFPIEAVCESIMALQRQGQKVVALADGDPLFFGIGASLAKVGVKVSIRPAISCLQAACARLGLPWHDVSCVSLHGRKDWQPLYHAIAIGDPICVLTGGCITPAIICRKLSDRGADWFDVCIFTRMGLPEERFERMSISLCHDAALENGSTLIFLPVKKQRRPYVGMDGRDFLGAYSSKLPVRGAILEMLALSPASCLWDIGAGSGRVSLEAAALVWAGRVIAIERDPARCLDIQENRRIAGAVNVDIRMGDAPRCLDGLPKPDRVFMGGGFTGADGREIIQRSLAALPSGGKFVAACILLDSFQMCRDILRSLGCSVNIMQIQAASGAPLGPGEYLAPANPVFALEAIKP